MQVYHKKVWQSLKSRVRKKVATQLMVVPCEVVQVFDVRWESWEYRISEILTIVLKSAVSNGSMSWHCTLIRSFIAPTRKKAPDTFCLGNVVSRSCWHSELKGDGNKLGISGNRLCRCPLMSWRDSQSRTRDWDWKEIVWVLRWAVLELVAHPAICRWGVPWAEAFANQHLSPVILFVGLRFLDGVVALDSLVCCPVYQLGWEPVYQIKISRIDEKNVPSPSSLCPYTHTHHTYKYLQFVYPFQTAVQACRCERNVGNHVFQHHC